ncbi:uncharacterized protein ISCGN_013216 [Ixodes scapularis]
MMTIRTLRDDAPADTDRKKQPTRKKKKDTVEDKLLKKLRQELKDHRLCASSGDPEDVASQARGPVFAVPALASAEEASARSKEARIKEGETYLGQQCRDQGQ